MALALPSPAVAQAKSSPIRFDRDIRPILSENCFPCHGADANHRKAKLRLDTAEGALSHDVLTPGKPDESEVITRIFTKNEDDVMPPLDSKKHLTEAQKQLLRAWVQDGAKYAEHWAFTAPVRASLPTVKKTSWARNPIDRFILARLEAEGLSPAPRAPLERLLRRVSLDLTGLPPTPGQLKQWRQQSDPYNAALDELLASPRFGERMASDWMDLARYADTHGFNNDSQRTMWRWRDWVIEAFNRNLPYNRFITEQIAGDLLEKPSLDQLIATGFNRNHVINSEGGLIAEEYRVEYVADRVQTTAMAWMGLTMGCARCHDHKFDPVTQKDYFQFFAFFNSNQEHGEDGRVGNAAPLMTAPTANQQTAMARLRATLRAAEEKMEPLLAASGGGDFKVAAVHDDSIFKDGALQTNVVLTLVLPSELGAGQAITNLGGGKPFEIRGTASFTNGPLGKAAVNFDGTASLKSESLRRFDSGKGWAFSTWVRRDTAQAGALFSTMSFAVPESADGHGRGVEIRFTAEGEIEVRVSRRWPAYSMNIVTEDQVPVGEWRHVLVTCDGTSTTRGLRVFLDGEERSRKIRHDNFADITINGEAQIASSNETNSSRFIGAMADLTLLGRPFDVDQLAAQAQHAALRFAAEMPPQARRAYQVARLHRAQLEQTNTAFAEMATTAREARAALFALEREAPTTMTMSESSEARPTYILFRGQYDQPRERVEPGVPEFLLPFPASAPRNRLGLAQWLTDPRQPLTARVVVNNFWQALFGTGIVKSVEDFGYQADWPSHPELLDWLAVEFVESGWDVKKLIRLMVSSATYCQSSDSTAELNERDPENRLLAHGPRQRLTAEMLRDQALAVSGLLQEEIGGPPVFPYQPTNYYKGIVVAADYPGTSYTESKGTALYRRSLYTFWKRTVPHPTLATFDAPDREVCVARRLRTNTPLQALALMNDPAQVEAARKLAERMLLEGGTRSGERLDFAFQLATARKPKATERKALTAFLEKRLHHYQSDPAGAQAFVSVGASASNPKLNVAELAAYANVASLILNLDETITRN